MSMRAKVVVASVVAVALVVGGAGTAYAAHYQDRALPGTTVDGTSVAGLTRDQVAGQLRRRAAAVTVTVHDGASTSTRTLADLGYSVDVDATVAAVFAANASWSSYATSLVSGREVTAVVHTDAATVAADVAGLVASSGAGASDASVALSADGTSFEATPAVAGRAVDASTFQDVVARAARTLTSATTTVRFVQVTADVTTEAAQKVADAANALVAHGVAVTGGKTTTTATAAQKASWVTLSGMAAPTVDVAKVQAWVQQAAQETSTAPTAGVRNVDATGAVRTVVTAAVDGKSVSNSAAVAQAAVAAMTAGTDYAGTFEYATTAATWTDRQVAAGVDSLAYPAADGEKWIDVNLTNHTMTAYVGATVAFGPLPMVNGAAATPTVVGTFHVYVKYATKTMRGQNADGSDYVSPDVPWASYFYRGYALHGAPWRSTFGYAASHGCINLPVSVAKRVYDFDAIGTPVVTHF